MGLRRRARPELEESADRPAQSQASRSASGAGSWRLQAAIDIHNAAAGVIDYRTGEVLAYAGSAGYTAKGNKKFHPQYDVLSDGYRQPGSAIKPINYLDRHR